MNISNHLDLQFYMDAKALHQVISDLSESGRNVQNDLLESQDIRSINDLRLEWYVAQLDNVKMIVSNVRAKYRHSKKKSRKAR